MVDDSELDYIRTFVGEVMTGYTIKQYSEAKTMKAINDTQKGLVYPGEIIFIDDVYFVSRYKLMLADASEAALTTGLKNLISGTKNYNRRVAGPTQVSSMTNIKVVPAGIKAYEVGTTKRWNMILNLEITWSVGA